MSSGMEYDVLMAGIQKIAYRADGTYTQWNEEYVKILTEEGRRGLLTLSSYFVIPYQRGPEDCRIAVVEIIRPDGSAQVIDVETPPGLQGQRSGVGHLATVPASPGQPTGRAASRAASAMRAGSVFTGTEGWLAMTRGLTTPRATGVKSRSTLYGRFL